MIRVALCQTDTKRTAKENVEMIGRVVEKAVHEGGNVDVVVLPEDCYFDVDAPGEGEGPEALDGYFVTKTREMARKHRVNLLPGTFMLKAEDGRHYNTALFINRDGEIIGRYDKMHLMKAMDYDESKHVVGGTAPTVIDTDFGRIGIMVCYDLRFPELARGMVQDGADILFVPAFFPVGSPLPPRTDHWDTLVNSAALLNLTYVVAVNQYGRLSKDNPFGRSCVVDPWGTVITRCANRAEIAYATLDLDYQAQVRQMIATWQNRLPAYYTLR